MIRKWIMRMIETEVESRMQDLDMYEVAQNIDIEPHIPDIAEHMNIDASDIAGEFDMYEVAENIELSNIVQYLDIDAERMASEMASEIDMDELASEIDMDELATLVVDELLSKTGYGWCHPEFFDEITNRVKVEVQP